ncbi:phosphonate transport system substrate-binding protein [Halanaerobium saccharolyticum]|uniref:Phosphonate transport system substrate-binding protein n=1 Tax=Halanaerobium saccharolyticum TaxID=43595 RepID=A0A4R7YT92_9FIRM|nr:phosphate/phosphite/phosphonate ABC transporter substrate-binding protein [Halanaerobium saccharolyticum]RAK05193.1 phosphonate transport system substrate-binding protein [Halanaerobium saccharolyticum]TDV99024.1 phosphonate transport system substrate-binding protein [Halanaerobium saccharolyticum]TDX51715.1 phosphonate transport system substrate-binding protein [Halanaerobium saccharolyticum]
MKKFGQVFTVLILLVFIFNGFVLAAEMDFGYLGDEFVDYDGDLVADLPADESEWINPDTIIFSYTPVEEPSVYKTAWADFLDHLAEVTGKEVMFYAVENYASQLEALRAGRIHIAGINTGSVPFAVNTAGVVPFAMMAAEDGSFGYEMEIITQQDSQLEGLEDLEGKTVAFVSQTSNSGFKAPSAILKSEMGYEAGEDYKTTFSGRHDNSIMGVYNGDYEAAAIANSVMHRMDASGAIDMSEIKTIYKSQTFPTTAYSYVNNLHPGLAQKIKKAFFTFDWTGTSLAAEFEDDKFIPIDYKTYWEVIRTIDRANGVEYK